jgi:uncharacterized phage-associated protein
LLFLISEAQERGQAPSQYDLLKAIFLADRAHLNQYGRPVTFDRYVAMKHGPVPSFAYDVLKPGFDWRKVGKNQAPWISAAGHKKHLFSPGQERPDLRKLSGTDRRCLSDALGTVLSLTFGQIRKLTHDDRAYLAAWKDEEGAKAFPINIEHLLDDPSDDAVDDLRYFAEMSG